MLKATHAAITDKGKVRTNNEDAFAVVPDQGIYLVSDGMGGEMAGELASRIVAEALPKCLVNILEDLADVSTRDFMDRVKISIEHLSDCVRKESQGKPGLNGMGATVVLAVIREGKCLIAHMGDSRAYLVRDGKIEQLTIDHSVVQFLLDAGEISKEEADCHPARGQLLRCVGMRMRPVAELKPMELKPKDKILLCSDGLTDMLEDDEIRDLMKSAKTPKSSCRALVNAANAKGGADNITSMVIHIAKD